MDNFNSKEQFTKPHLEHTRHLPALHELQHAIEAALESVSLDGAGDFTMATKICCYAVAEIVADLNRAILQSLTIESFSAAETLSRTSLENSINLVLLNKDLTSNTPKAIFINHFKTTRSRAVKWHTYASENNQTEGMERASGVIQSVDMFEGMFGDLDSKGVKGWPNVFDRFKNSGHEFLYHQLFAPASDASHSFTSDIFNRYLMEKLPGSDEEIKDRLDGQQAEKISYAYYMATHALQLYCLAASHISVRAQDFDANDKLAIIGKILAEMLVEHETLSKNCLDLIAPAKAEVSE